MSSIPRILSTSIKTDINLLIGELIELTQYVCIGKC